MGTGQLATLIMQGFDGPIYPIHPTEKTVLGLEAYAHIEDVGEVPDMVVMVLPTGIVPGLLDDCGKVGIKARWSPRAASARWVAKASRWSAS